MTETSPGTSRPAVAQRVDRAERQHVGGAQQRGRARSRAPSARAPRARRTRRSCRTPRRLHRRRAVEPGEVAGDPLAADLAVAVRDPLRPGEPLGGRRSSRSTTSATRSWPSAATCAAASRAPSSSSMPTKKTPGERGSSTITTGTPAAHRRGDRRVRVGHAVQAERAHDGVADRHDLLLLAAHAGQQEQLVALRLGRLGQALEEADGAGIGERVGQPLGEHEPDRAAPAGPQPPRGRVRPGVAELLRRSRAPSGAARERAGPAGCRRSRPSCARRPRRRRSSAASPALPPGPFYRFRRDAVGQCDQAVGEDAAGGGCGGALRCAAGRRARRGGPTGRGTRSRDARAARGSGAWGDAPFVCSVEGREEPGEGLLSIQ